jgi:hypothetical protein
MIFFKTEILFTPQQIEIKEGTRVENNFLFDWVS